MALISGRPGAVSGPAETQGQARSIGPSVRLPRRERLPSAELERPSRRTHRAESVSRSVRNECPSDTHQELDLAFGARANRRTHADPRYRRACLRSHPKTC